MPSITRGCWAKRSAKWRASRKTGRASKVMATAMAMVAKAIRAVTVAMASVTAMTSARFERRHDEQPGFRAAWRRARRVRGWHARARGDWFVTPEMYHAPRGGDAQKIAAAKMPNRVDRATDRGPRRNNNNRRNNDRGDRGPRPERQPREERMAEGPVAVVQPAVAEERPCCN